MRHPDASLAAYVEGTATARERATVVTVTLRADGTIPPLEKEEAGEARGDFEGRVKGRWRMVPLAEADREP